MLDSIYHNIMTYKAYLNISFLTQKSFLCTQRCYGRHNVSPNSVYHLGENRIQNLNLVRCIVG